VFLRILLTAIFNLALGYSLAWYLHGPRGLFTWSLPRWLPLGKKRSVEAVDSHSQTTAALTATAPVSAKPTIPAAPAKTVATNEPAPKPTPPIEPISSISPVAATDSQHDEILKAVTGLHDDVTSFRASLKTFDERLREYSEAPDERQIRECAENFRRLNQLHLQVVGPRISQIERAAEAAAVDGIASELAAAVERQIAGIELAQEELARLGPEVECLMQCQQMLDETRQLTVTSDQLDATIEQTLAEINRIHEAIEPMPIARSTLGQLQSHSLNLDKAAL
jgi:hypothetical protein